MSSFSNRAGGPLLIPVPAPDRHLTMTDLVKHQRMANAIRALAMDAVEKANSGHPGLPMGAADIATVLFTRFLKFDPTEPYLARPRPLRAFRRPRLDAALFDPPSPRRRGDDDGGARELPSARLEDPRPSREFPHHRRRDDHRPARPGPRQRRRHGDRRASARGRIRRRDRRSPDLRHRLRRRPDGRASATRRYRSPAISSFPS